MKKFKHRGFKGAVMNPKQSEIFTPLFLPTPPLLIPATPLPPFPTKPLFPSHPPPSSIPTPSSLQKTQNIKTATPKPVSKPRTTAARRDSELNTRLMPRLFMSDTCERNRGRGLFGCWRGRVAKGGRKRRGLEVAEMELSGWADLLANDS